MNTFVSAIQNQKTVTDNGMRAGVSTTNACVDLFFKAGAMRGQDIIPAFVAALVENEDHALRIAQWLRDVREGAGERQLFRNILLYLEQHDVAPLLKIFRKIPELGRWDDLLIFENQALKLIAFSMIRDALREGNSLCAKWCPREKSSDKAIANELREFLGLTPRLYRKLLSSLTKVVESDMCQNNWSNINFSHVPSRASSIYSRAFNRHTPKYAEYVASLIKGDDPEVKVNAGAIYPYDVIKGLLNKYNQTEIDFVIQQWNALPNYVGDANIFPMVDVSGSMDQPIYGSNTTCMDVALSLGLYLADKNKGKFADAFLTFSEKPELLYLKGNIKQKYNQMISSKWGYNTNIERAFQHILKTAIDGKIPQSEMPGILLILSDMQFDRCVDNPNDSALKMIKRNYKDAGYEVPKIVFWNLNSRDNVPVKFDKSGTALVSGFSPSILKSILKADLEKFTPYAIMLETIMNSRYDY